MTPDAPLLASQLIVRVCLFLVAAIALFGGALQMFLGSRTPARAWTMSTASWRVSTSRWA